MQMSLNQLKTLKMINLNLINRPTQEQKDRHKDKDRDLTVVREACAGKGNDSQGRAKTPSTRTDRALATVIAGSVELPVDLTAMHLLRGMHPITITQLHEGSTMETADSTKATAANETLI